MMLQTHIICIYKTAKTVYYVYIYINGIYIYKWYIYIYLYIYIYSLYNPKNHCFFFSPNRQGRSKDPVEAAGSAGVGLSECGRLGAGWAKRKGETVFGVFFWRNFSRSVTKYYQVYVNKTTIIGTCGCVAC